MNGADDDARRELRALTHALRSEVRRRSAFGVRRVARASAPAAHAAAPAPEPARAPAAAPPEPAPAPATEHVPPARSAPLETTLGSEARPLTELARKAAELRDKAAAIADLGALREAVAACEACDLCKSRTQTVFADGDGGSGVMFVGEAPGYNEDVQGVPFVGNAGDLLTDIIRKGMGLERSAVTICNVLKCRPPENRDPRPEEKTLCTAWLDRQIELVNPGVIIALGRHAAGHLLASDTALARMRGRVHERDGRKVVATYHPAFLLRSPGMKKECWRDIQLAMRAAGIPVPKRA